MADLIEALLKCSDQYRQVKIVDKEVTLPDGNKLYKDLRRVSINLATGDVELEG